MPNTVITKDSDIISNFGGPGLDAVGDQIAYTVTVSVDPDNDADTYTYNVGLVDAVADLTYASGDANANGTLDTGEIFTYTGLYTLTRDDFDTNGTVEDNIAGQIDNTVQATLTGTYDSVSAAPRASTLTGSESAAEFIELLPGIDIEKATNGEDADDPTGPRVPVGSTVTWTYVVTNTGNVALSNVAVTDDQGVTVSFDGGDDDADGLLDVDETWLYSATGTAVAGQYANLGSVSGSDPAGTPVDDEDPSHYFGAAPAIDIEKATNGEDADDPTGPTVPVGSTVTWTYVVTNTGNQDLSNVVVTDDQGVAPVLDQSTDVGGDGILSIGETWTYTATGTAQEGQYANMGAVTAENEDGQQVTDEDPSHYLGEKPPEEHPGTAMTPGFWKNHPTIFQQETGVSLSTKYESIFGVDVIGSKKVSSDPTMLQALSAQGGGEAALLRASTAGWANASSDDLNYCFGDDDSLAIGVSGALGIDPSNTTAIADGIAFVRGIVDQIDNAFTDDDCLDPTEVIKLVQDVYDDADATTNFFHFSDAGTVASALDAMNNMPHIEATDFLA